MNLQEIYTLGAAVIGGNAPPQKSGQVLVELRNYIYSDAREKRDEKLQQKILDIFKAILRHAFAGCERLDGYCIGAIRTRDDLAYSICHDFGKATELDVTSSETKSFVEKLIDQVIHEWIQLYRKEESAAKSHTITFAIRYAQTSHTLIETIGFINRNTKRLLTKPSQFNDEELFNYLGSYGCIAIALNSLKYLLKDPCYALDNFLYKCDEDFESLILVCAERNKIKTLSALMPFKTGDDRSNPIRHKANELEILIRKENPELPHAQRKIFYPTQLEGFFSPATLVAAIK